MNKYSPSPEARLLIDEFTLFQSDLYRQYSIETDRADYARRIQQWLPRTETIAQDVVSYHYLRALIELESVIWLFGSAPTNLAGSQLKSSLLRAEQSIGHVINAKPDFADAYALQAEIYEWRIRVTPILRIFLTPLPERLNRIALRLDSRNPRAHFNLANHYLLSAAGVRGTDLVIAGHRNALRYANPDDIAISVRSGLWLSYALTLAGEDDEALVAVEEVLRISQRNPIALVVREAIIQGANPIFYLVE